MSPFEQWWDGVANTPAPNTFKNWEESCRQAWLAGAANTFVGGRMKIVGWMNPCNGVLISPSKKLSRSIGHGYPNFSQPVYAIGTKELGE